MQRNFSLFFILCVSLLITGCENRGAAKKRTPEDSIRFGSQYELDREQIITKGNRTFIPLDFSGDPNDFAEDVLDILNEFERTNEVSVVSWKFATPYESDSEGSDSRILGMWIDHKPVER